MKLDLHVHTLYSPDAVNTIDDIRDMLKYRGIDGIAITDHDTARGAFKISKNIEDYLIIPGIEITTPYGHILLINLSKEPPITENIYELKDFAMKENCIMAIAHPLSTFRKSRKLDVVAKIVDAVEVANSHDPHLYINFQKLDKLREKYNKGVTAGSDSHIPDTIGYAYIETASSELDGTLEDIRRGTVNVYFKKASITHRVKKLFYETLHRAKLYRPVPP